MTVFVSVKAPRHAVEWLQAFRNLIASIPGDCRSVATDGEADYKLRIVVPDIETYDLVYQRMISRSSFPTSVGDCDGRENTHRDPTSYVK